MSIKQTLSTLRADPVIIGGFALGVISLAIAAGVMWQQLVVEPRLHAANVHYGLSVKVTVERVNGYIDDLSQTLNSIASQPQIAELFVADDQQGLDQLEITAAQDIENAESIYFIDRQQQRHIESLGYAAKQMVRQSLNGSSLLPRAAPRAAPTASPRAVKIDQQWQLLISQAVPSQPSADGVTGVILLRLSIDGLTDVLNNADTTNGTLEFQQLVPNRNAVALISIGESSAPLGDQDANSGPQIFDTNNPRWKIAFTPSQTLLQTINRELPPFWLFFTLAVIAVVSSLLGLVNIRSKFNAKQTAIFVEKDSAEDALFAPEIEPANESALAQPVLDTVADQPLQSDESQYSSNVKGIKDVQEHPAPIAATPSIQPAAPSQDHSIPFVAPDVVFRDYDIRGIADTEITPEFATRLGKTLGSIIIKNGHKAIYVGRDGRLSSRQLGVALRAGLKSTGCKVIDLGEVTTPVLNFAVHHDGQSTCGIMITASHNPAHYNGFKIIIQGQVIAGQTLQLLKPMLQARQFMASDQGQVVGHNIVPHYIREIVAQTSIDRSFRIVIDAGNAVAGPVALQLFDSLGCLAFPIYCEVDGSFPNHDPNPADEKNLQGLIAKVKEVNADLGFAFDGDGDRLVVISGNGDIIWPDQLMMIFARDILSRNPGADIVFDVKSSKRLAEVIRQYSGRPVMCKTGHSHVRKAVQQNSAPLGGEFSGHIFFNDRWKGFDDGPYAAVRLLEILCADPDNKTLDAMIGELDKSSYTPEILIPIDEADKFSLMATVAAGCQFNGAEIITLDGLRVEYAHGWGLIRASNTSASLTLRFEADDDQALEDIKQRFRQELSPFINNMEDYF